MSIVWDTHREVNSKLYETIAEIISLMDDPAAMKAWIRKRLGNIDSAEALARAYKFHVVEEDDYKVKGGYGYTMDHVFDGFGEIDLKVDDLGRYTVEAKVYWDNGDVLRVSLTYTPGEPVPGGGVLRDELKRRYYLSVLCGCGDNFDREVAMSMYGECPLSSEEREKLREKRMCWLYKDG